jgi:hypothetical protein
MATASKKERREIDRKMQDVSKAEATGKQSPDASIPL